MNPNGNSGSVVPAVALSQCRRHDEVVVGNVQASAMGVSGGRVRGARAGAGQGREDGVLPRTGRETGGWEGHGRFACACSRFRWRGPPLGGSWSMKAWWVGVGAALALSSDQGRVLGCQGRCKVHVEPTEVRNTPWGALFPQHARRQAGTHGHAFGSLP